MNLKSAQDMVRDFHIKYGFPIDRSLEDEADERDMDYHASTELKCLGQQLTKIAHELEQECRKYSHAGDNRMLRIHLIVEELGELADAAGRGDEVGAFDAICDLLYVVIGTAVTYDLPCEEGFAEVHRSNMTKPPRKKEDVRLRNKTGYEPPQLATVLANYSRK